MTALAIPEELWVFGYGSLMWRPGFEHCERQMATLTGFHRALCVYSHHHRGTARKPGLVLGLDKGGACRGLGFRVPVERRNETIAYLREREQVTSVYLERVLDVRLADGRRKAALTYIVDRKHPQYAGKLDIEAVLAFVRQGRGHSGDNADYVLNTHAQLHEIGVDDPVLTTLSHHLKGPKAAA
jgi:cation transport protein ChaC